MGPKATRQEPRSPLLRWAGSKRKLLDELQAEVPTSFGTYIEPFVGSACLYFRVQPRNAILSDLNPSLIQFYRFARATPDAVLRSAIHVRRSRTGYYRARARYRRERNAVRRAGLFLFLNRFCFNGIYRTNAAGEFNVPFGMRTGEFPTFRWFRLAARSLARARLLCSDFEPVVAKARKGDFVYLDPPYVYQSRKDRGEYGPGSFSLADIPRLCRTLDGLDRSRVRFLLSYLDCEEIQPLKSSFDHRTIPVARTVSGLVASRQVVSEVLIKNY
jgi:DNA adenine methylase